MLGMFMFKFINENLSSPLLTIFNYNCEVHTCDITLESHLMLGQLGPD